MTRQQPLLAALKGSGVLSALSAALLAAPPCPEVAPDEKGLPDASSLAVAEAELHVFRALGALAASIAPGEGPCGATELLAAPDVQRLRWAALEQMGGAAAAAGVGGGGGGSGACGGAGAPLLQLLQPHVIRYQKGMGGCLLHPYACILTAALHAPAWWLSGCQAGATPSENAARLAAAKKLLPPLRRLPPLAASCARAACAEVKAELRGLTAAASATAGPSGSAGAGRTMGATSAEVRGLYASVAEQLSNLALTVESVSADGSLPDLVETFGWALQAAAAVVVVEGAGAAAGGGGGGRGGDGDGGSGGWRAQDELGLLVSLAKLARRQAEVQGGDATPPYSTSVRVCMSPVASHVQHERDSGAAAPFAEAAAAVREAAALASVTALPILGRVIARSLGSSSIAEDCSACIAVATHCLAAAVQLLPPADLLALQPQRTLAQLGVMLQRALGLQRPGAGQGSCGGGLGGREEGDCAQDEQHLAAVFHKVAGEVAEVLMHMAGDEQLVGVVAGWLRGEAAEAVPQHGPAGRQPQPQEQSQSCGGLDARALAAALRHWDAAAADEVIRLHGAAAAAAAGAEGEGGRGGSRRRTVIAAAAAASADGAVAPLLVAARAAIARRPATLLWGLQDGGVGGLPSWPPRCLRLCGNPGCRSFAGASEAALPLRKCSGCKAVRYCGAGCQRQHWQEGGHKAACAQLRAAMEAARGGD
ncbi:hypothetical protein TSOC_005221 [Tetrabaena socialis]|uniref:phytol kinase n=1 Tax=Tetrabaena socialis TaxID=47790 RepID=A0A2J8A6U1_9CHLO|nr:hypothetical protein TSOC_005221 [Tetrabaena socialis]|eukprot:PNH08217.1 hypothetical protein TSOC_005221 [Tetrabaena socialis]